MGITVDCPGSILNGRVSRSPPGDAGELPAILKAGYIQFLKAVRQSDLPQHDAAVEGIGANSGYAVWNGNVSQ